MPHRHHGGGDILIRLGGAKSTPNNDEPKIPANAITLLHKRYIVYFYKDKRPCQ